jgi:hypothetical protein
MTEDSPQYRPDASDPNGLERHLKSRSTWLRLIFMIVMTILYAVSRFVVGVVIVVQFFTVLFSGDTNPRLKQLGQALATYTYQILQYLMFNTEQRPFPFDDEWPIGPPLR